MAEYSLGNISAAALENIKRLQQQASQPQRHVFDSNGSNRQFILFAFDGTGDNKNNEALGAPSNVARIFDAAKRAVQDSPRPIGDAFYYPGPGPGTQDNPIMRVIDGATGMTVPDTVKTAYDDLVR